MNAKSIPPAATLRLCLLFPGLFMAGLLSLAQTPSATNTLLSTNIASLSSTNSLDDKYLIAIGDRLSFRIVEDDEDPVLPMTVTDAGDVEVPYLGRFPAAKKTCRQLSREIKAKLEETYYLQATVLIAVDQMSRTRGKVYLNGYVRVPGPQDIPSDESFTLSKALMRAGGFTEFADKKRVRITRQGDSPGAGDIKMVVDAGAIIEDARTDKDVILQPGDFIFIPSRLFKF